MTFEEGEVEGLVLGTDIEFSGGLDAGADAYRGRGRSADGDSGLG